MTTVTKNENNGYTIKEMLGMTLDKIDKIDEKRVVENKRIYDKLDGYVNELKEHNSNQDVCIKDVESLAKENRKQINRFWGGIGSVIVFISGLCITVWSKLKK